MKRSTLEKGANVIVFHGVVEELLDELIEIRVSTIGTEYDVDASKSSKVCEGRHVSIE